MVTLSAAMEKPPLSFMKRLCLDRNISPPPPLDRRNFPPQVFQIVDPSFTDLFHELCFGVNGFGLVSTKGRKNVRYVCFVSSSNKLRFFGVYDGLERGKAAEFVANDLHKHVFEMMKNCEENGEKEEEEEAFKASYMKTHRDFLEKGLKSGGCCVTVLIQDEEMIVSNLGGCRAVLCTRGGVAKVLTSDHKEERIENVVVRGGYVAVSPSIGDANWVIGEPETRVFELEEDMEFLVLASASLWDVVSNQEAADTVLNVLGQGKTPRETEDEHLIQGKLRLVSFVKQQQEEVSFVKHQYDVLWPVESPKSAKTMRSLFSSEDDSPDLVAPTSKSEMFKAACKELANLAVSRGREDDITVVIVDLNHHKC